MNPILINIGLAAAPSVLIIAYVYRRDRGAKEPRLLVFYAFVLGFFAVIPALALELAFSEIGNRFAGVPYMLFRAFVVAALVEEGVKLGVVRLFLYNKKAFDEVSDGMLYTITASLGFAFFENVLYSFGPTFQIIIRGVTAVPLHAAASGVLGYYIGTTRITGRNRILTGLLWAILIHGLYDFLLFTGTLLSLLVIPLLIISLVVLRHLFRKANGNDSQYETFDR
jgi:protease PrsW